MCFSRAAILLGLVIGYLFPAVVAAAESPLAWHHVAGADVIVEATVGETAHSERINTFSDPERGMLAIKFGLEDAISIKGTAGKSLRVSAFLSSKAEEDRFESLRGQRVIVLMSHAGTGFDSDFHLPASLTISVKYPWRGISEETKQIERLNRRHYSRGRSLTPDHEDPINRRVEELVRQLDRQDWKQQAAWSELVGLGERAVPMLVYLLHDTRTRREYGELAIVQTRPDAWEGVYHASAPTRAAAINYVMQEITGIQFSNSLTVAAQEKAYRGWFIYWSRMQGDLSPAERTAAHP